MGPSESDIVGKQVGERVRSIRTRKKLSQNELARLANIWQPDLSDLENGRRVPTLETLFRVVKALGITMESFWRTRP